MSRADIPGIEPSMKCQGLRSSTFSGQQDIQATCPNTEAKLLKFVHRTSVKVKFNVAVFHKIYKRIVLILLLRKSSESYFSPRFAGCFTSICKTRPDKPRESRKPPPTRTRTYKATNSTGTSIWKATDLGMQRIWKCNKIWHGNIRQRENLEAVDSNHLSY